MSKDELKEPKLYTLENYLPVFEWAKNLAYEYEFEEEIYDRTVTASYPRTNVETDNWKVEQITVHKTPLDNTEITLHCVATIGKKKYYQPLVILSPTAPATKNVSDYVNATVSRIVPIASIANLQNEAVPYLLCAEIRLVKTNKKSSTMKTIDEFTASAIFKDDGHWYGKRKESLTLPTLNELEFIEKYFDKKKPRDLLKGFGLEKLEKNLF